MISLWCLPFDLHGFQLSAFARADHGGHALLHLTQNVGRHRSPLRPTVRGALQHVMFNEVLFVAIVREDHRFSFGVAAEHHVGVENAAEVSEERRRMIFKLFWRNVDHQDQVTVCQLFGHVVGTVQAVPFAFCVIAALVAVTVSIVVFTVLVIQRAGRKEGDRVSILIEMCAIYDK